MVPGQLDSKVQKNKVGPWITPSTKIYSKWIKNLNERAKTHQRKTGVNLPDLKLGNNFLTMTPKA